MFTPQHSINESLGSFHSTQNSRNFSWYIKWNQPFWFCPTGILGTSFEGGPLWLVWSFQLVGPKCPFPFDKIVSPPIPLFCIQLTRTIPKRAVAWVRSVQPECTIPFGTWNFQNFKLEFSLNVKFPCSHCCNQFQIQICIPTCLMSSDFF